MTEILTAAEMRELEKAAIESGEVTGLELMERAGRGVVEAVLEEWPEMAKAPHRAGVLCGPGNNGGDGFVVARLLKERGWEVEVFLYGDAAKLPPDARVNYERWIVFNGVETIEHAPRLSREADLFVDALFGTGLTRALEGECLDWVHDLVSDGERSGRTVAVDIPSGLCSDSGRDLGSGTETVLADLTVSFHALKLGHVLRRGPHKCGKTVTVDIGLSSGTGAAHLASPTLHYLVKASLAHKYSHGHALILAGPSGKGGAARLAARGALRIGAGAVTLGCPEAALAENAAQLNAIMLRAIEDAVTFRTIAHDSRIDAFCSGPGHGVNERTRQFVASALETKKACVLDADALTAFEHEPRALKQLLHPNAVLTPHLGEFRRLFPDIAAKLEEPATRGPAFSKVDATREAAARMNCTVLFKGPDTVIADPKGRCVINASVYDRAAPWLATAGSGDVLAGFITGLMARGYSPFAAAETGAWLHTECALKFGPGLIAEDLPEILPAVFRDLGV